MKNNRGQHAKVLVSFLSASALGLVLISNPVKADEVSPAQTQSSTQTVKSNTTSSTDKKAEDTQKADNKESKPTTGTVSNKNQEPTQVTTPQKPTRVGYSESEDTVNAGDQSIYSANVKAVEKAVSDLDKANKAAQAAKKKKVTVNKKDNKNDKTPDTDFNPHISFRAIVKKAGNKNYAVYNSINSKGKPTKKIADGINYINNHLEATEVYQSSKYRYWLLYVDGVRTGWVNEHFFARNQIMVPKAVSLVKSPDTSFYTRDALSYATDDYGTVVGNWDVKVSSENVDTTKSGTKKITYTLGKAKAVINFKIRKSNKEGIATANAPLMKGTNSLKSWSKHYGHSPNYVDYTTYAPETDIQVLNAGDMTFTTKYYQPLYLNQEPDIHTPEISAVGHIPEGSVVNDGWLYTSLLAHSNSTYGHIVAYNLNELTDPYQSQSLSAMSIKNFTKYVKNMKVSPYIYTGHGQGMGASKNYIYIVANEHNRYNVADSETLLQIRKSDMQINKIWTFKAWVDGNKNNPRYFHNANIVDDNTMYALYHNTKNNTYEYWMFKRSGSNWYPTEVGATDGNFVADNAPVQGLAYDTKHQNFYIALNDLIVKVGRDGTYKDSYAFDTGREIEGISISNNRLYVNLAQRPELLESSPLTD